MKGKSIAIIGAGISGLYAAKLLEDRGANVTLFDQADRVGGRMRTYEKEGFLLDRGFHVLQTAYPTSARVFDWDALGVRAFEPGALVVHPAKGIESVKLLADPFRRLGDGVRTAVTNVGRMRDLVRVAKLRDDVLSGRIEEAFDVEETSARELLDAYGFSKRFQQDFFEPLLGGIFLESELETSSRFLRFIWRMMAQGDMVLPAGGIEAAPKQLATSLRSTKILLQTQVEILDDHRIKVGGRTRKFDAVIQAHPKDLEFQDVWTVYFDAPRSPLPSKHLLLPSRVLAGQLIRHVSVPSDVQPTYAPVGRSLVCVTVLGDDVRRRFQGADVGSDDVELGVRTELASLFGKQVFEWRTLDVQWTKEALPRMSAGTDLAFGRKDHGLAIGDWTTHGSVEGALRSAKELVERL